MPEEVREPSGRDRKRNGLKCDRGDGHSIRSSDQPDSGREGDVGADGNGGIVGNCRSLQCLNSAALPEE